MYIDDSGDQVVVSKEAWAKLSSVIETLQVFLYYDGEWNDVVSSVEDWNTSWN